MNGQVMLAPLPPPPTAIKKLLTEKDSESNVLCVTQIRAYNQLFAFTSIGTNLDKNLANAREGVYTYRIQGTLYYRSKEPFR